MNDTRRFRAVMGHFATGVVVVTGRDDSGGPYGLTANSVASVSLAPPLVLVCVARTSESHDRLVTAGAFAINILGASHEWLARRFSEGEREERFGDLALAGRVTGAPVLEEALAWLDCELWHVYDGGDHSIIVGEVQACDAGQGEPLVFFRGQYREGRG